MNFKERLALEASAGSGKTFALTIRYISLLLSDTNPSNIVALTFTKKAAAEMRERIYHTMQDLENHKVELQELSMLLGKSGEEILKKKEKVLPLFLKANIKISTIDSFFGQILRKFALHLGLMPNFTSSSSSNELKLQKLFLQKIKSKNSYEIFLQFAFTNEKSMKDIFKILSYMYEKESEICELEFKRGLPPKDDDLLKMADCIKCELEKSNGSQRAINTFDVKSLAKLLDKSFWSRDSLHYWDYKKVYTPKLDELFFRLKDELCSFYRQKERYLLGELLHIFGIYSSSKMALAKKISELTFTDITNAVYELLYRHIDSEFLYFRLDGAVEHLLIDEFQDTNIVQYKILEPIIKEIQSGVGTKEFKSFFYVGDTKQSIYRFRGGAKSLFSYASKTFFMNTESLMTNYRSKSEIVDFINHTFKDKIEGYKLQNSCKKGGFVQVLKVNDDSSAVESVKKTVQMLVDANLKLESIAILCAINKDVWIIKEALLEKFPSIPLQTESRLLLIHSKSVIVILEFFKYLYFKDELFGRKFQALRGADFEELPNIDDFNISSTPLNLAISCISHFRLQSDMDTTLFLEVVSKYDDLESLLFSYEDIKEVSVNTSNRGLNILTIHKSKGLEFSYVIVCDMLQKYDDSYNLLLFDYEKIKLKNIYVNFSKRELVDGEYKAAKEKEERLEEEDRLNQIYVAFTRAKDGLIVVKKEKNSLFGSLQLDDLTVGKIDLNKHVEAATYRKAVDYKGNFFGFQNITKNTGAIEGSLDNVYFGLALHFTLEMMSSFDEDELSSALIFTKDRYGFLLEEGAFESIRKRILGLIGNDIFINLISLGKVFKEQPYMFDGKQRQIDIMVEYLDRIIVIDYKSSYYTQLSHIKQVQEYKMALEAICKKRVDGYLCYLHENKTEIINLDNA